VWRRWLAAFGAVAFMAVALAVEWWWLPPEGYAQRYGHTGDQYKSVDSLFIQLVITSWHWFRSWFDHDTITTLAIVATAIFTGTLWRATDRLWRISQIHAGHTEQSISVAERSATAATVAMNAAEATAQAAADQAEIARKSFILAHRPRIRVIHITLGEVNRRPAIPVFQRGNPIHGRIGIRNVGETDATIRSLTYRIFVTNKGKPDRFPINPKTIYDFRPHQRTLSPGFGTIISVEDEPYADPIIQFPRLEIYFFARITYYFGAPEIYRITAICRKCALPQGYSSPRLVRVNDPELEYEE
jgi:hypothetical protein